MKSTIFEILQRKSLRLSLCALALSLSVTAFAQDDDEDSFQGLKAPKRTTAVDKNPTVQIKGTIVDLATGKPIAGVKLQTLNDNRYAGMTNANGEFTMKVPTFATALYVQAPRYMSQQVAINNNDERQVIKISMISDEFNAMYGEGTEYTAAKTAYSNGHGVTIDDQIVQKLGADVRAITRSGQVDGGAAMFIRGLNSLTSNSQPLIIVDGVEMDMQQSRDVLHAGQSFNMLANISPQDIDKVTVLKNATALYGARGANGVILIDTKRGHSMATRIDADLSVGFTTIPSTMNVMNATQYRNYATEMIGTMPVVTENPKQKLTLNFLNDDPTGYYYRTYHNNTDWSDYVYRTAMTQNYSINVQGGDDIGMYNLSVGYITAKETAKNNDFDRLNVRFNTDIKILWNFTTKFDMSFSRFNNNVYDSSIPADLDGGTITSPTFLALIKSPLLYPYQYNANIGGFSELLCDADDMYSALGSNYSLANPVAVLDYGKGDNKNKAENTFFNAHVAPKWVFNDHLDITEDFSYTLNRNSQKYYRPYNGVPSYAIPEVGTVTAKVASAFSKETNVMSNTHLNWQNKYGAHTIAAVVGFRYNYFSYDANNLATQYTGSVNDKNPSLSASTSYYQDIDGANDVWKNLQWYVNADYNYMNRYFVTLSALAEANSRFGANCSGVKAFGTHWAVYPSVQLGWVLTNEKWFPKHVGINYLRLNAGFDMSGNDDISNYAARTSFTTVNYGRNITGIQLTNVGNDEIKAETTTKWNVGLEAMFLNNRLGVNFNYYIHKTKDLLTLKTFDNPIAGINSYWCNGGKLENHGYEAGITMKPIVSKDWHLEIGATVGHYDNKVTELPTRAFTDGNKSFSDGTYLSSVYGSNNVITSVGNPIAMFYGYQTAGVFATDAEARQAAQSAGKDDYLYMEDNAGTREYFKAGDVHFVDQNGDGKIDENDKTIIGNPNPDIYGNIYATLNWKRFTLNLGFNYSLGNDVYNYQKSVMMSGSNLYNQSAEMINHWYYEGQVTSIPRISYGDEMGNSRFSDRWIEDGSYLRLKTLSLTYQIPIPESWTSWLQGLSVWAEANNLFTLTRYSGTDPEFSIANGVMYQGVDAGNLAQSRTFTFGLKINL